LSTRNRRTLSDWKWWETQLAVGLLGLIVAVVARDWTLAGIAAFIAIYALIVMGVKWRWRRPHS
jgi:hypothetical protein